MKLCVFIISLKVEIFVWKIEEIKHRRIKKPIGISYFQKIIIHNEHLVSLWYIFQEFERWNFNQQEINSLIQRYLIILHVHSQVSKIIRFPIKVASSLNIRDVFASKLQFIKRGKKRNKLFPFKKESYTIYCTNNLQLRIIVEQKSSVLSSQFYLYLFQGLPFGLWHVTINQ